MAGFDLSNAVAVHIVVNSVFCDNCENRFEPFGTPSFDDPNFCSDQCEEEFDARGE